MGIGRGSPEIRFAVAATFDDVSMSAGADVKLQRLNMHSTRRTEVPLDLNMSSWEAARNALGACSYPQAGRFLLGPSTKRAQLLCNTRCWGSRCWRVRPKSFLWLLLASSDPSNLSTPSTVPMPFPDVPWQRAATKDSYTLIPKRTNI